MNLGNKGKSRWLYGSSIFVLLVFIFIFTEVIRTPSSTLIKTPISSASPNPPASISPLLAPTTSANLSATVKPDSTPTPTQSSVNTHSTTAQFPSRTTPAAPKSRGIVVPKGKSVTTKTTSGSQTITVNTKKVTVTINPTATKTPTPPKPAVGSPVASNGYKDPSTLTPQIPDWNGFVAPKVTFDKITACRALGLSTITNGTNPITGKNDYNSSMYVWNLTPQFKLFNGKYLLSDVNGNYTLHNISEIVYKNDSLTFEADSMTNTTPPSGGTVIELKLYFKPFNWTPNSYGEPTVIWAPGYETDKVISYAINVPYKTSDCQ